MCPMSGVDHPYRGAEIIEEFYGRIFTEVWFVGTEAPRIESGEQGGVPCRNRFPFLIAIIPQTSVSAGGAAS
jgi:hypothetical protein